MESLGVYLSLTYLLHLLSKLGKQAKLPPRILSHPPKEMTHFSRAAFLENVLSPSRKGGEETIELKNKQN